MRDIQTHLYEIYGTDVSAELISKVTDAVVDELVAWQSRPLEAIYPIVYLDAIFMHTREGSYVVKKAVYLALGVTLEGNREVLGMWIDKNEGAKFWLSLFDRYQEPRRQRHLLRVLRRLHGISSSHRSRISRIGCADVHRACDPKLAEIRF